MNDLISRQDAINAICNQCSMTIAGDRCTDDFCLDVKRLQEVPSAQKKGEWIQDRLISTNGGTYGVRRCSNCENYYQDVVYGWNFCPNCGADMRRICNEQIH